MTIVEIVDAAPIHNIMGGIAFGAEKIIYVGSDSEKNFYKKYAPTLKNFYTKKSIQNVEFEYVHINRNDFEDTKNKLSKIAAENESCYFDISGGEDITLSALGVVFAENPNIHLYQVNPLHSSVHVFEYKTDSNGNKRIERSSKTVDIKNTFEENVFAHGGSVVFDTQKSGTTYTWDFTDDFLNDIDKMWQLCCDSPFNEKSKKSSSPRTWNRVTTTLGCYEEINLTTAPNELKINIETGKKYKKGNSSCKLNTLSKYLDAFKEVGLITYGEDNSFDILHIKFKNEQVKLCLTKAGNILELKTYLTCKKIMEERPDEFADCMTGVTIDWDGVIHDEAKSLQEYNILNVKQKQENIEDTVNEIDVVLMRGMIPYFISCKNGKISNEELYKLYTVRDKFGKDFGKTLLVTTDFDKSDKEYILEYISQRAEDMGIKILKNVHLLSDEEFKTELSRTLFSL